jgi:imidazolonepropionase-like amidohydrolase
VIPAAIAISYHFRFFGFRYGLARATDFGERSGQSRVCNASVFSSGVVGARKNITAVVARERRPPTTSKKYRVKTALGADIWAMRGAGSRPRAISCHDGPLVHPEALKMATADSVELMALSGYINPYPGKLGLVEVGVLADLLLVDGMAKSKWTH